MLKFLWYLWIGLCLIGTIRGNYRSISKAIVYQESSGYILGLVMGGVIGFLFFALLPVLIYRGFQKFRGK